jgi:hypothetical protein
MKKTLLSAIIVCFLVSFPLTLHGIIPVSERDALIELYNSTAGAGWTNNTNWNGAHGTEDTWFGITTSGTGANEHVVGINLENNNLTGTIPAEMEDLSFLESLDMSGNSLSGSIPTVIGNLSNLHTVDLGNNSLSGSIPTTLGGLTDLQTLILGYNNLSGSIPRELGSLSNLRILYLRRNELTRGIPSTLGDLVHMTTLNLSANQLYGVIPAELGSMRSLQYFYIDGNGLTGTLPPHLGNLTELRRFYCNGNNLSGSIPPELGDLVNLQRLRLADNEFSGAIPAELGDLTALQSLTLYANRLTGSIPSTLQNLTNLGAGSLNMKWNGLYTDDAGLLAFLNSIHVDGDWESSQTIAPDNTAAVSTGYDSIRVTWDPIVFTGCTGGYRVLYSTVSGGPYTYFDITADKTVGQMDVTGLAEGTTYYFVVQTRTDPHEYNTKNTVDSEYSDEASATTSGDDISGFVRTSGGQGVADVVLTFSNGGGSTLTGADGSYSQTVSHGWSGTVTPSLAGYTFDPASRTYTNVIDDQTGQNYTATAITPLISGRVTLGGGGLAGVTLTFSNGGGSTVTAGDGSYSHAVSYGWSGTVTPSLAGYTFDPSGSTYTNVISDMPNEDYTATAITPAISGRVTFGGSGLANVTLTFSNGGGSTTTGSDGNYSLAVSYGWSGTVTPSRAGYNFNPSSRSYSNTTADNGGENYTASEVTPVISGRVSIGGTGLSNVTLTFSNGGGSAVTDNDGNYSQTVSYGWSGAATPSREGYTFNPLSRNYNNVTGNEGDEDYTATAITPLISGRVTVGGSGLANVTLTFSNGGGTAATDSNGNYSHAVSYDWSGTVTPSRAGYNFEPAGRSYSNVTSDIAGENYSATAIAPVISGRVTDAGGAGMAGVTLTFSSSGGTTVTDSGGNYAHAVSYGWSGTVSPGLTGYTFTPAGRSYSNVTTDQTGQNYAAAMLTFVITGRVAAGGGTPVTDVTLTFSGLGTVVTGADGVYSRSVAYGWSGSVTPFKEGYTFEPVSRTYTNVTSGFTGQDFVAAAVTPVISGHVTDSGGTGISGVDLSFSGGVTATTDSNGYYSAAVAYGWSGDVTPAKDGFTFDPTSRTYTNVTTNQTGDYIATAVSPVISGRVADANGTGIFDVTLTFSNGGGTATTDANGNYVQAVPYGWSGTVTPSKTGFSIEPASRTYTDVTTDQTGRNYTGTAVTPLISGRVADSNGTGLSGVTLVFSNGGGTVTTDSNGNYLQAVPYEWSGTVIPSKTGYIFEPAEREYDDVSKSLAAQDYTATAVTPVISGRVMRVDGSGMAGVPLHLSPGEIAVVTDSGGNYTAAVGYGWSGTVTPSLTGFYFIPEQQSYFNVTAGLAGQDYTAMAAVTLYLQVSREKERAWVVSSHYGDITLTYENFGGVEIDKLILYRKAGDGNYAAVEEFQINPGSNTETFTLKDEDLEKELLYTYKVEAVNINGEVIGVSEEITI